MGSMRRKVLYDISKFSAWACHLSTDVAAAAAAAGQSHFYGSLMALLGLYERADS